jgi:hypothetical protein
MILAYGFFVVIQINHVRHIHRVLTLPNFTLPNYTFVIYIYPVKSCFIGEI